MIVQQIFLNAHCVQCTLLLDTENIRSKSLGSGRKTIHNKKDLQLYMIVTE